MNFGAFKCPLPVLSTGNRGSWEASEQKSDMTIDMFGEGVLRAASRMSWRIPSENKNLTKQTRHRPRNLTFLAMI